MQICSSVYIQKHICMNACIDTHKMGAANLALELARVLLALLFVTSQICLGVWPEQRRFVKTALPCIAATSIFHDTYHRDWY